ncbi:MAG TPA: type II toxin-antitoxin system VapC family toxin [Acetobacteraceae bacterium]
MIAVDTSALIAILQNESEASAFVRCLNEADAACLSAISLQEASMVMAGRTGDWDELDDLVRHANLEVVPHDRVLAELAREAFLRFGKGRNPARLNCGDCASYALAKSRRIPLLFKGAAFAHTDIRPATAAPPA